MSWSKILPLIIYLATSSVIYPQDNMSAIFKLEGNSKQAKIGEVRSAIYHIVNPSEELKKIFPIKREDIAHDGIKIFNISAQGISENNADVYDINFDFAITKDFTKTPYFLIQNKKIKLRSFEIKIEQTQTLPSLPILPSSYSESFFEKNAFIIVALSLFILVVFYFLGIVIRKQLKIRKLKALEQAEIDKWKKRIKAAQERKEYEFLYNNQKKWIDILDVDKKSAENFLSAINDIQYKPSWDELDLQKVKNEQNRLGNGI